MQSPWSSVGVEQMQLPHGTDQFDELTETGEEHGHQQEVLTLDEINNDIPVEPDHAQDIRGHHGPSVRSGKIEGAHLAHALVSDD